MKQSITKKITGIVVMIVFTSVTLLGGANFFFSFRQTLNATGVELTGCANITTGIIGAKDLLALIEGDNSALPTVNQQLEWTIAHKPIFATNYILGLDGRILATDQHLEKVGLAVGDQILLSDEIISHLRQGHTYHTGLYTINEQQRQTGYAPIFRDHNPQNELIAINAIDFEGELIRNRIWEANQAALLLAILLPICAAFITFIFVRKTMRPIHTLQDRIQEMTKGDLSSPDLIIENQDELGLLASGFNQMRHELKKLILDMKNFSETTNDNAQELFASSEQTQNASHLMTNAFDETERLINKQEDLTTVVNEELTAIAQQIQEMTASIHHSTATADETAKFAHSGNLVVDQTLTQIDHIHLNGTEAYQISETLNQKSQEIDQVMTLITHISKQTNLLALNASIEAARSQKHGSGFLIIAEEIRELSVQTKEAAEQVSLLIQELQTGASHSLNKSIKGQAIVKDGLALIQQTKETFHQISFNAVENAERSQSLSKETEEIQQRTLELVEDVQSMTKLAQEVTAYSHQTSEAGHEQTAVMRELVDVSRNLSVIAEQLRFSVKKFSL